ncbi:MAG: OprD family outer membrane porin [Campylobacterales bacterium]|nr:OprD family outer membrane porin [Campylobacterales bacterium]
MHLRYTLVTAFVALPLYALDTPIGSLDSHIELFHYNINSLEENTQKDAYATAIGGFVAFRSKPLWGHFGLAYKHYLSHLIFDAKNPCSTALCDSAGKDINPLAQLYLYYQDELMEVRLGRQQLDTPLINNDTTRLIPFSYEALSAQFNLTPKTKLSLGHVTQFRTNISEDYTQTTASGYAKNGVSYIGLTTSYGNLKHQWYYYHAKGLFDALHTEVCTRMPYDKSLDWLYGVQAIYTFGGGTNIDNRANGGDDVKLLAAKIGLANDRMSYVASLSYNFGEDGINRGYGGLSSLYTTSMITGGKKQGHPFAKSLKINYTYDSKTRKNAYSSALYLTNVTHDDPTFYDINAIYIDHKFHFRPREYIHLRFEKQWIDNGADKSYFRIISAYEF